MILFQETPWQKKKCKIPSVPDTYKDLMVKE